LKDQASRKREERLFEDSDEDEEFLYLNKKRHTTITHKKLAQECK